MLFSIGVTTYNRNDKLKLCIESLLRQTYHDFEILVGNDYVKKVVELTDLDINDARIKIFNYKENLGELGNMNMLLSLASGQYFTILSDDDLFATNTLEIIYNTIQIHGFPNVVFFPLKRIFDNSNDDLPVKEYNSKILSGSELFEYMLKHKLLIMGESCFYKTDYLKANGGFAQISNCKIAFYTEYFLIARAILEKKILFIDAPLLRYRDHEDSWSASGKGMDIATYREAGENLIALTASLLHKNVGTKYEKKAIKWTTEIHLKNMIATAYRIGTFSMLTTMLYIMNPKTLGNIQSSAWVTIFLTKLQMLITRLLPYLILSIVRLFNPKLATKTLFFIKKQMT